MMMMFASPVFTQFHVHLSWYKRPGSVQPYKLAVNCLLSPKSNILPLKRERFLHMPRIRQPFLIYNLHFNRQDIYLKVENFGTERIYTALCCNENGFTNISYLKKNARYL
jgi:hypothetical protein